MVDMVDMVDMADMVDGGIVCSSNFSLLYVPQALACRTCLACEST
jgi:hypothetical protein